jgi:hypothetical protein
MPGDQPPFDLVGVKDDENSPLAMMGIPHFVGGW